MPRLFVAGWTIHGEASMRPRGRDTEAFVRSPLSRPNTLRSLIRPLFTLQFSCLGLPVLRMIIRKTGRSVQAKD
jgi:hypothetical protein